MHHGQSTRLPNHLPTPGPLLSAKILTLFFLPNTQVESTIPHHANKEPPSTSHAVQASKTTSFGGHYDQDNEKQGLLESKKPQVQTKDS